MNKHIKNFLHRGLIFGGFGPIVVGLVIYIIDICGEEIALDGQDLLLAVTSSYVLAFVHAGASVFNEIESWPITKSLLCHFSLLFVVYSLTYVINSWIPFEPLVLLIFCTTFVATYLIVWLTVYLAIKARTKKLNSRL